jgi:hypothetical protein
MNTRRWFLVGALALAACGTEDPGQGGPDEWMSGDAEAVEGGGEGEGGGGDDGAPFVPEEPVFREAHPRIYLERNEARLGAALAAGSPAAQRFRGLVDAQLDGGNAYKFEGWFAALIGQLTGEARYCAYAIDEVDAYVASEEARIAGGERAEVAADSYLYVGEKIGDVMLTYDWCFDALSAAQRGRWLALAAQAVWNVWHHEEASWGGTVFPWSGWSVDNPSNNYYYSFLRATMLFGLAAHGEHPDAAGWLAFFRDDKIGAQLMPTFAAELEGGGSREGTGYGTAMMNLWSIYDLWFGSTGEDLHHQTGHGRASLVQMLHAIVPTRDRLAPIGDHARDQTAAMFDYHRVYIAALAHLYQDDPLAAQARWFLARSSVPQMTQAFMYVTEFLYDEPDIAELPIDTLGRAYHGPGVGVLYARSGWETDATWVNLIAGPYSESHAHHDQGSFMLYKGEWLAYDANVQSESGISQGEALHNLVRIAEGATTVRMREGTESAMVALARGEGWLHAAADLTPAYDGHPAVSRVEREVVFLEPDCLVVFDRVTTAPGTTQTWQLNTPIQPSLAGARATMTGAQHTLRVERLAPASAATSIHDLGAESGDEVEGGYRVDAQLAGGEQQLLHVLWIDDAAGTVTRSDAEGRIGAEIQLAGGRTATVRFGAAGVDGTLTIREGGATVADETLAAGVSTLAE